MFRYSYMVSNFKFRISIIVFYIKTNIRIGIGFIDFMLGGKKLTDYTNLFSPHDLKKNDNLILSYFKNE